MAKNLLCTYLQMYCVLNFTFVYPANPDNDRTVNWQTHSLLLFYSANKIQRGREREYVYIQKGRFPFYYKNALDFVKEVEDLDAEWLGFVWVCM